MPNRVAIITGAAQGIGRAIALRLAKDGLDVVVNDIPSKLTELNEIVKDIKAHGSRGIAVTGDASAEADVENLVAVTVKELGGIDVFVANAGIFIGGTFAESTVEQWDKIMNINARGVYLGYRLAAKQMVKQGRGGRIIGACSTAGKKGDSKSTIYALASLPYYTLGGTAMEFGPHGITVNAYAPGFIETPLMRNAALYFGNKGQGDDVAEEYLRTVMEATPTRSLGTPEDVAGLVSYIASEESNFVTGQALNINGGTICD